MDTLVSVAIIVGAIYTVFKVGAIIMRARSISKAENNIDVLRDAIFKMGNEDLEYCNEQLREYHKQGNIISCMKTEEEVVKSLHDAQAALEYEDKVYFKYIRARERFAHNDNNHALTILYYHQYLAIKNEFLRRGKMVGKYLEHDVMTVEEMMREGMEYRIKLEEAERRLDNLLEGQQY